MKSLTKKYPELSVILIHHTRKMKSDNPMENMSGTTGLTGATEINMVLESRLDIGEVEAKIAINGKDPKSQRLNIKFNETTCRWDMVGVHVDIETENEELAYAIDEFLDTNEWMGTVAELVAGLKANDGKFDLGEKTVGIRLPKINKYLENHYKIVLEKKPRTKKGWVYQLKRVYR